MKVIGLDLGTTTLSAVVVDVQTGKVLETLNVPNQAALPTPRSWERLQDADVIVQQALQLTAQLKSRHDVAAIGIDGQMHGAVYLDRDGHAVSPLYSWQDQRGELPLGGSTYAASLSKCTGYAMATGYGLTTHYWHVLNGAVPVTAACLCTVYDYVGMKLTGRTRPLMHASSAASFGLYDARTGGWDLQAVQKAGMDAALLPEVTDAYALLGHDQDGIPVAVGLGDNQASFIGSVSEMEGTLLINMGTGGQISMASGVEKGTANVEARPLGEKRSLLVGSVLCGGKAYALLESFLRSCAQLAGCLEAPLYEQMNQAALRMLEADNLPQVDPRFSGTRSQPALRGSIRSIGMDNFDARHLIAGTLMGMAEEMHSLYEEMLALGVQPVRQMVGSGNAIRKNPALRLAFEKVFGMPMHIPAHAEEAACGAALTAMAAAGLQPSLAHSQQLMGYR